MTVGSLFSGIGGFDLGLERAGFSIAWQVENNDYCREVLKKHWPAVPCHYDIRSIDWEYIPRVDLVCGGFPCQPFSCAGKRQGKDDDRYLWPEVVRCLAVLRPTWFLGENVYGLLHLGIEQVCADLEALGYQVAILGIPACAVDAQHIRKRLWILAHTASDLWGTSRDDGPSTLNGSHSLMAYAQCAERRPVSEACDDYRANGNAQREESTDWIRGGGENVADSENTYGRRTNGTKYSRRRNSQARRRSSEDRWYWPPEPSICRVAHGVPARVDRLKGLGNAIVPQIAEAIGRMILEVRVRKGA